MTISREISPGRFDTIESLEYTKYSYNMVTYTTITSKGQITIPVEARRALGLQPGQKVSVRVEGERLVIDPPRSIDAVRERIRAERTSDSSVIPLSGDGWAARAEDFRG